MLKLFSVNRSSSPCGNLERSAELEGTNHGIHTVYFLEDLARDWDGHVTQIQDFISISPLNAIKPYPLITIDKERLKSPWMEIIKKCSNLANKKQYENKN